MRRLTSTPSACLLCRSGPLHPPTGRPASTSSNTVPPGEENSSKRSTRDEKTSHVREKADPTTQVNLFNHHFFMQHTGLPYKTHPLHQAGNGRNAAKKDVFPSSSPNSRSAPQLYSPLLNANSPQQLADYIKKTIPFFYNAEVGSSGGKENKESTLAERKAVMLAHRLRTTRPSVKSLNNFHQASLQQGKVSAEEGGKIGQSAFIESVELRSRQAARQPPAARPKEEGDPVHLSTRSPYDFLQQIKKSLDSVFSLPLSLLYHADTAGKHPDVFDYHNRMDVLSQHGDFNVVRRAMGKTEVHPQCSTRKVRLPRLLFFGGDIVSVTALEALYERMSCIIEGVIDEQIQFYSHLLGADKLLCKEGKDIAAILTEPMKRELVRDVLRNYITVVCPSIPPNTTPQKIARQFRNNSKQYPVLRFCLEKKIPFIPVDHPKSLKKSKLLEEMLSHGKTTTKGEILQRRRNLMLQSILSSETIRRKGKGKNGSGLSLDTMNIGSLFSTLDHLMEHRNTDEEAPLTWADLGLPLSYYDLAVVVSFRYFLPTSLLQALPPTINMHPSVLPHYRGASPIFSTLLNNEEVGGVSIIQIKKEDTALMDSGHVLWQCEVPIEPDTDIRTYFPLVTQVGAAGLCDLIFGEGTSNDKKSASSGKVNAIRESTPPTCGCAPPKHGQHKTEKCWRTLCRSPSQLTSVAIERALETHKLCFHHNIKLLSQSQEAEETTVSDRKKRPTPSETQIVTLNCAEVFPDSVLNASSDWPDSFTYSWRFSQSQNYEIILSNPSSCQVKNTVSTYFCNANSKYKSDPYHAPLLPKHVAVLKFSHYTDKDCFGVWRSFVGGEYFSPSVNATLDKTCTPVRNQLVRRVVRQKLRKHLSEQRKQHGGKQNHDKQTVPYDARPKPKMVLDESMITRQMILESVEELRLSCSFTQAVHPDVLSPALEEELEAVESGDVYFYRAPPPLFQSILSGAAPHVVKTRILINTKEKSLVLSSRTGRSAGLVAPSITEARDAEALRALLAAEEEDKSASEDEHTPDNYVPEVILIPAEVRCERRKAKPPVRQEPSAEETVQQTSSAGRQFYIPPGTGYFPICDDTVGCIKCSEGWFIWKEAHLKYSSKPQPASLLRKGLAMKNGILYPGLFSEYS